MKGIAEFKKVSFEEFLKSYQDVSATRGGMPKDEEYIEDFYANIKLPERSTKGSAGYDFCTPFRFILRPNDSIIIPTGIRCKMEEGWVLQIYPRSSLGFKYSLRLNNTVGIIDSDYYYSDNEGHIKVKLTNESVECKTVDLSEGMKFCQGIFLPFGVTKDDDVSAVRNGGFGSTGV